MRRFIALSGVANLFVAACVFAQLGIITATVALATVAMAVVAAEIALPLLYAVPPRRN